MALKSLTASGVSLRWNRILRQIGTACCLAAISGSAVAGDNDGKPGLPSMMQSSVLRHEARVAAERGDFLNAAQSLEQAAELVGDRVTAQKAAQSRTQLEAGGGASTDFQSLMQLIMDQTSPPALWIQNGDDIGSMTPFLQGVFVGAPAIASAMAMTSDNSRLITAADLARTANANHDVREASSLRLVSLPRLERHIQALQAAGQPVTEDMQTLAGLTSVEFLFVFPETGDVVIGGPAGGWAADDSGRFISDVNQQPTLQLDDLVTLSRTFSSGGQGFFMCTIDPKPEQVRAVNDYVKSARLTAGNTRSVTKKLEDILGMQNVTVQGVPQNSRVASVIVDADYQMKLIGIGKREGADGMKSYFELAGNAERRGASMDALRWWMTVGYESINVSPDRKAFEFAGQSIACHAENQKVNADGSRNATGKADGANAKFAELFTQNLPELAEKDVVFADLQNVFDLALATSIINTMTLDRQAGWAPSVFTTASQYETAPVEVPKELLSAANSRVYRSGEILIQVAGGIRVDVSSIVKDPSTYVVAPEMQGTARNANPVGQQGRWWWDAAAR